MMKYWVCNRLYGSSSILHDPEPIEESRIVELNF